MSNLHFYDLLPIGKTPAEGQVLRYHSTMYTGVLPPIQSRISVALRDDVAVDPVALTKSSACLLDIGDGEREITFARQAHKDFTATDTLHVGFGSTTHLDAFVRFSFYRNLLPFPCIGLPNNFYSLDIETVARAVAILRPDELPWRAEMLKSNGDALYQSLMWDRDWEIDDRSMRIKELLGELSGKCPRLLDHAIKVSSPSKIRQQLGMECEEISDLGSVKPAVFVHSSIAHARGAALLLPVCVDINYPDIVYMADLESDLTDLCSPDAEFLDSFVRSATAPYGPLVRVTLSKVPFVAPLGVLRPDDVKRLKIDMAHVQANLDLLRSATGLIARLRDEPILSLPPQSSDVDHRMWAGDFPEADIPVMLKLHSAGYPNWMDIVRTGIDRRLVDLALRVLGRDAPALLDEGALQRWQSHRLARQGISGPDRLANARKHLEDTLAANPGAIGISCLIERLERLANGL